MTQTTPSMQSSGRLDAADEAWLDGLLREAAADLAQEAAALDGVDFSAVVLAALPAQQLALSAVARPSAAARLLAWLMLAAGDKPFPYFGFHVPAPVAIDPDFAKRLKYWHELLGSTGYWLIGLHAVAAVYHHHFVRDNTLRIMLPERK